MPRGWILPWPSRRGEEKERLPCDFHAHAAYPSLLLAVLLLAGASISAQELRKREVVPDADIDEEPLIVFRNIEKAWQSGNAQALADLRANRASSWRFAASTGGAGISRSPRCSTSSRTCSSPRSRPAFTFVKFHNLEKQDSRIYGMALRSYKINRSGGLYKDKVYVTLVKEGSRWAVAEIKSTW